MNDSLLEVADLLSSTTKDLIKNADLSIVQDQILTKADFQTSDEPIKKIVFKPNFNPAASMTV